MEQIDKAKLLERIRSRMNQLPESRVSLGGFHTGEFSAYGNVVDDILSGTFDIKEPETLAPTFQKGDKVRHKTDTSVYLGEVLEISKTGKTARVQWTKYDPRTYVFGAPWPAYYRLNMLKPIKEGEKTE